MRTRRFVSRSVVVVAVLAFAASVPRAQAGLVLDHQKIGELEGGFGSGLSPTDHFGSSIAPIGDLDGDGNVDIAVGAPIGDNLEGFLGEVWILLLDADGTVKSKQRIDNHTPGVAGLIMPATHFGSSVAGPGDLDGDGIPDLAVGHPQYLGIHSTRGAVWIFYLQADGNVKSHLRITENEGGFNVLLDNWDSFGSAVCSLGDLDGDGFVDLAAGARRDDDGGDNCGAVWILFLDNVGAVKSHQKISNISGGFGGGLLPEDRWGSALVSPGDLDGDGTPDLVVGAPEVGNGVGEAGILFLRPDGTVRSQRTLADTFVLSDLDFFGCALASPGDLDGDGVPDLVVGEKGDKDGGYWRGAAWILFLSPDGTHRARWKISDTAGGFTGGLADADWFGAGTAGLGDLDGDGFDDLAVGAPHGIDGGSVYVLSLQGCPLASAVPRNPSVGGFTNPAVYDVTGLPVLGTSFVASIGTTGKVGSFLLGYAAPATYGSPWGNVLVDATSPGGELLDGPYASGNPATLTIPVPDEPLLCGALLSTQGLRVGGGFDLTNAQDLVVGR